MFSPALRSTGAQNPSSSSGGSGSVNAPRARQVRPLSDFYREDEDDAGDINNDPDHEGGEALYIDDNVSSHHSDDEIDNAERPQEEVTKPVKDGAPEKRKEVSDDTRPSSLVEASKARRMVELRKNAVKFSGGANEDVEEWLDKLDMIAGPEGFNLDYYDQTVLLKLSVSGAAYQAAKMVP
ncbi:hypothetical protein Pmar_PMAR018428, partial [Perkinsus marinus ATCC 50983]